MATEPLENTSEYTSKDIQVLQELTEQWVKDHPNSTDLDAAEYYAHLCVDYLRGK